MYYDIRNISLYFKEVHSRYYIDTEGNVYSSLSPTTKEIVIDGRKININEIKKNIFKYMNGKNKIIVSIPNTNEKYYLKFDGVIMRKLCTRTDKDGVIDVNLIRVDGVKNKSGNRYKLHRLLAGCFLGDIKEKEIHHKDRNRKNNKLSNLLILTMKEHRGKGNNKKNHFNCATTICKE